MAGLSSSTDSLSTATSAAPTAGVPTGEVQAQQLQAMLEGDVDAWLEVRLKVMGLALQWHNSAVSASSCWLCQRT